MGRKSNYKNHSFLPDEVNHISYFDHPTLCSSCEAHNFKTLENFFTQCGAGSSSPSPLGVYVHISPTDSSEPSEGEPFISGDRPIHYLKYRSILSRFEHHDYEEVHRFALDLHKIRQKIRWIQRRLDKDFLTPEERQHLTSMLSRYAKFSNKLLNNLAKRLPIYADRFFVEVPQGYAELIKYLGYPSDTLHLSAWVTKGSLELSLDGSDHFELDIAYLSKVHA